MKIKQLQCLLLWSLLPSAWATLTTKSVLEACTTDFCTTSAALVPTTTTTHTLSQVGTAISIPSTTVIPNPATVTVCSTTLTTSTKTIGNVLTLTSTTTIISRPTTTITATASVLTPPPAVSVTVTPTSTVPTSSGQVFQSNSPYNKKKRGLPAAHPHVPRANPTTTSASKPFYPTAVTCGLLVDVSGFVTSTASKTLTVTACPSTVKVTSTVTGTITATNCHASVTTTATTTSLVPTTLTETVTVSTTNNNAPTTVTISAAATTVYAACVTQNLLTYDPVEGMYVDPYFEEDSYYAETTATSNYDCCVACQTNDNDCSAAIYNANTGVCHLSQTPGQCDPTYHGLCELGLDTNTGQYYCAYPNGDFGAVLTFFADEASFMGISVSAGPCGQADEGLHGYGDQLGK